MNTGQLLVKPGTKVKLASRDPGATGGYSKVTAPAALQKYKARMAELQEVLYAERKHALLVVLQAMDAGGKDGTIRNVMTGMNPQGCTVTSFKAPSEEELSHDFLWRIHNAVPGKGHVKVFNRSHYEDVLIVRVHKMVPKPVWSERYRHINTFERLLDINECKVVKFFLHISKDEQKKRLEERLADPTKLWKVNPRDFEEHKKWDDYMAAYEDALSKCSTSHAPWYIIPANKKWYRNVAIAQIIVETLEGMNLQYPKPAVDPAKAVIE
jgi:PPK2 family polyphosphate:nucleotide phosphotransferase